ncbi:hypothetical protein KFE25_011056 [Diacronema lutheri]|uniref:OTU domain-containing protein n=1 Tax=Diacronema lutheri TaxID=2081491 RepID=A0A8J5XFP1_DIALT|nr:hypothetical protein KFE25_011056 [Diacronema lutheri]
MGKKGDAEENARRKAAKRAHKQQRAQGARPETSASVRTMLKRLGLRVRNVEPDGNCQFRAVADQLYGDPDRYRQVRTMAIAELERNAQLYKGFVTDDEPFDAYVARMRDESEWGDMTTLVALASSASLRVIVHQNDAELPRYELVPHHGTVVRTIHVLFDPSVEHYDSVRALGDGADGEPPASIPWAGGEARAGADAIDELVDELAAELGNASVGSAGKRGGKSARDKRAAKPKTKKQMQAEALQEAKAELRREELSKTLSV